MPDDPQSPIGSPGHPDEGNPYASPIWERAKVPRVRAASHPAAILISIGTAALFAIAIWRIPLLAIPIGISALASLFITISIASRPEEQPFSLFARILLIEALTVFFSPLVSILLFLLRRSMLGTD